MVSEGIGLSNVTAIENPSPADVPGRAGFPVRFFGYSVQGVPPGESTTVTLILPPTALVNTYYKYGRTPDNQTSHWYEFLYDEATGAEFAANVVTLHFVDREKGDFDLAVNGVIVDLGAHSGLREYTVT